MRMKTALRIGRSLSALFVALLVLLIGAGVGAGVASAQPVTPGATLPAGPWPGQINQLNIAVTPTCAAQSLSQWLGQPFYKLYMDETGDLCVAATVSATATTVATASSTPTAVSAGPNQALNMNLFSSLFVQPTFAGTPVDGTHGLPTNCIAGCSGGAADESAFTAGTTSVFTGGFFQTTPTSNPLTTGQIGVVQMTAQRAFFVNPRNSSGTEIGTSTTPIQVSVANTGANGTAMLVTGTGGTFPIPANSSVNVTEWDGSALGAPSNYGTSPGAVAVNGVNAYVTNTVAAALNTSPSLANGNGVVPTQGGSVLSSTNGLYSNLLQGNAVLSTSNPIFVTGTGTAGSAATNPITVQGIGGGTNLPVSQGTASALNATVVGAGSAGTANAGVETVQGIASMTPILTNPGTAANWGVQTQGSTTSGQSGVLMQGATTTSPPSYTTADTNPISTDRNGGVRLNPACTGVINVTQTATTDVHTFTGFGYICSVMLVSATAQNVGIDEGTGTTCESSGTALIGVSSTSSATATVALAANGGFSMVSGIPLMKLQASGDHICVVQSSTGNVSGTITYADLTN